MYYLFILYIHTYTYIKARPPQGLPQPPHQKNLRYAPNLKRLEPKKSYKVNLKWGTSAYAKMDSIENLQ